MNVSLTPELERFVRQKVDSGLYTSSSEVVREALRLRGARPPQGVEAERATPGDSGRIDSLERGEGIPFDPEDVIRRERARREGKQTAS